MSQDSPINAFTVDVEDYYHVSAFEDRIPRERWDEYESRVVPNTERMLKLLDEFQVRGTFFILGWVADRHPQLVRDIQRAGHEIGCHSFWHRLVYNMTPDDFREDLLQSAKVIEEITGERVTAYRAPSFSITAKSLWALDILIDEGFRIDSSVFPVVHDRYGIPGAERAPHVIEGQNGQLAEFPPSVYPLGKWNLPISGGGYFRLFPRRMTKHCLGHINTRENRPFMFYVHPWELDHEQPRLAGSRLSRFRHYVNLKHTQSKLRDLLGAFRFGTLSESLQHVTPAPTPSSPAVARQ